MIITIFGNFIRVFFQKTKYLQLYGINFLYICKVTLTAFYFHPNNIDTQKKSSDAICFSHHLTFIFMFYNQTCYLSIVAKNSSFDTVLDILSFRNSMASTGVMSAKWLRNAQTLANVRSSTNKSSRRVPDATMSMAG